MNPPHRRDKPADIIPARPIDATGPTHRFSDSVEPQTPLGPQTPVRKAFPNSARKSRVSPLLRWAIEPAESLLIVVVPVIFFLNWEFLLPRVFAVLDIERPEDNPFAPCILLSHRAPGSDPRYGRGKGDITFIAYHVVVFSLIRQFITGTVAPRVGRFFGLTRTAKLERFGEQGYAFVYFFVFGAWGVRIMSQLPTWWYRTEHFWIDYPHTLIPSELKRYYLMQTAYWMQQFLVLVLGLEKPRKDYAELVAHHIVTLFLVIVSYVMNLTFIGSAVYLSMDIPDMFLALSKLLNYIQWNKTNNFVLATFFGSWTYFRHYLNLVIIWSVWFEVEKYLPAGTILQPYVRWGAFCALILLQLLNLFWYYLILRIVAKVVLTSKAEDVRSDDEDDGEEDVSTAKPLYPAQGPRFAQEIASEDSSAKENVEETPKALTR
ncbi:longevity assurance proteins LAG1/LAC1 [Mycena albidolilacea]|uniref:Longevity assurance proteins LAG1/LAC1 n=1 Tax=Mycena albidolilacea TaxID=1033008 RepID=A0AAD7AGQ4_9AGAR|nr:longevity assurance proteins LAG1/LAC1 [Mycena albidolilacea]